MPQFLLRVLRVVVGLAIFSFGSYLIIRANVGLAPWEAFHVGFSLVTPLSYGAVSVITGVLLFLVVLLFKEPFGFGILLDAMLCGPFVDLFLHLDFIPLAPSFSAGIPLLLLGLLFNSVGMFFYMGAALGCGPRDSLMVLLGKRLPRLPIGAILFIIEGCALLVGWLLGAKVGLGTLISVVGASFFLQGVFRLFRFDATAVRHENIWETCRKLRGQRRSAS